MIAPSSLSVLARCTRKSAAPERVMERMFLWCLWVWLSTRGSRRPRVGERYRQIASRTRADRSADFASCQRRPRRRTQPLRPGRIHALRKQPHREMVAHVLADLRDLHLLVQREEHTEGLNRSGYYDSKAWPDHAPSSNRHHGRSNVAFAALMMLAEDAPVRGSPSSQAT